MSEVKKMLEIVRKALYSGQISATKVDGQRAFEVVEDFCRDVLSIAEITDKLRYPTGGHLEFNVSGNGESWGAWLTGGGAGGVSLNGRSSARSFELMITEAGAAAREQLKALDDEDPPSR